jgi:carbamoyltransferase
MSAFVGVSGAKRNACAALCVGGRIGAAVQQERLTRVRGVGLEQRRLPVEAVDEVLALGGCGRDDATAYVIAERRAQLPPTLRSIVLDHHQAHAATAFLTSPFEQAVVLVCDRDAEREISVWKGSGGQLRYQQWPWRGRGFATLYSECAELFAFACPGEEHHLEALAHLGQGVKVDQLRSLFRYADGGLEVESGWRTRLEQLIRTDRLRDGQGIETASAIQRRIGELLLEFIADIRAIHDGDTLCLGGGFFYNTYFTTLIRRSGMFQNVFVPIDPGNAGLAVGATLMLAWQERPVSTDRAVSPFLGREYDAEEIKATLDGCKLSYSYVTESEALDTTVHALTHGQLVGWCQGRMEWGHRALGHRSILADPGSPYVLDNLNSFLRKRERWRSFGVSVREDAVGDLFCGPPASRFMEFEYGLRDDRLRHIMPKGAASIRVQTVAPDGGPFWTLHNRMEQATGVGVLVNTSFNGFREPIACSPRDAVRVFYGTGLDILVMGRFILRK